MLVKIAGSLYQKCANASEISERFMIADIINCKRSIVIIKMSEYSEEEMNNMNATLGYLDEQYL